MNIRILSLSNPEEAAQAQALRLRLHGGNLTEAGTGSIDVAGIVRQIIAEIAAGGDAALVQWEKKLDRVDLTPATLRVPAEQIRKAHAAADPAFLGLVRRVIANIKQYQGSILHKAPPAVERGGRSLGVRYTPIDRAGVYVPGMKALYPSTVLMTIVPAQVAGVKQIAIASPPLSKGDIDPLVLALAGELGIDEVYRLGGAVAIAAMALGTGTIPRVFKIVGPGNAFVAEAKRQLFGRVGIDSIAGPSEVLILADDTARADWVAADMLAQAEHNPGSAILVTPSATLARGVERALQSQVGKLSRAKETQACLEANSCILVVRDLGQAAEVANEFATEHLQIITADDDAVLKNIRNAGAIFVGPFTPVPVGDYYAGPSHVLPTGGTARFFSPLSCNEFLKASSVVRYDAASLAADAADIVNFATREGLTAHAKAVEARLDKR